MRPAPTRSLLVRNKSQQLKAEISKALRVQCSPRHVPDDIFLAPDIPYTLSGKKMEVPVKKIFLNLDGAKKLNREAIRNPESMDFFIDFANSYS